MDTYEKKTTRQRLAEKSKTTKGRAAYEKVAEEMRKQSYEEELEEEIQSFWNRASGFQPKFAALEVKENGFAVIARHFAKWGAEHAREQMMKDAIHYVVQDDLDSHGASYNIPFIRIGTTALKPKGIGVGDKVRIIIVKED